MGKLGQEEDSEPYSENRYIYKLLESEDEGEGETICEDIGGVMMMILVGAMARILMNINKCVKVVIR